MNEKNYEYLPYIGYNGNWHVNDVDTGIRAQGPKGDDGPQGPAGIKGDDGPQGPAGVSPELAANLTTTVTGKALDATMGKVLNDVCSQISKEYETIKKSVSNGKNSIAAAITRKKVPTAADASFDAMANNIDKIKTGSGNALPEKVLYPYTFTADSGVEQTGSLKDCSGKTEWWSGYETVQVKPVDIDHSQGAVTIPNRYAGPGYRDSTSSVTGYVCNLNAGNIKYNVMVGKKDGNETNCIKGTYTSDADTNPSFVLENQSYYCMGQKRTGTMKNFENNWQPALNHWHDGDNLYFSPSVTGRFTSKNSGIKQSKANLGITPDKIVSGMEICGVVGSGSYHTMTLVGTKSPIDIKPFNSNYKSLTIDNFIIKEKSHWVSYTANNNDFRKSVPGLTFTYDSVNGLLTVKGHKYKSNSGTGVMTIDTGFEVYLLI